MAGLIKSMDSKVKKMNVLDLGLTKFAVIFVTLAVAKLWSPILSLDWYWYLMFGIILAIKPLSNFFSK
ncbi:MAG: hypothetical protein WC376_02735 [Candidatus Nanoarchaeia archaeon]|jgi:hypothetical protein